MAPDFTDYAQCLRNAEHFKALGFSEIYLSGDEAKPWGIVTKVEAGGAYRLGVPISLRFKARANMSGLRFVWHEDLEPDSANGTATFQIDPRRIRKIFEKLPNEAVREAFRDVVGGEILPEIAKRADELHAAWAAQLRMAREIRLTLEGSM